MSNRHYCMRAKDAIVREAEGALRAAQRTHREGLPVVEIDSSQTAQDVGEKEAALLAGHKEGDAYQCHNKQCGAQVDADNIRIIVFTRVIDKSRDYPFLLDDKKDKYLTLCADCYDSLGLIETEEK